MEFEEVRKQLKKRIPKYWATMNRLKRLADAVICALAVHKCCPVMKLKFYTFYVSLEFTVDHPGGKLVVLSIYGNGSLKMGLYGGPGKEIGQASSIDYSKLVEIIKKLACQKVAKGGTHGVQRGT